MLDIPKAIHFVYLRGGLSLRWLIVLGTFVSCGGCQSIFCHPFPIHSEVLIKGGEGTCADEEFSTSYDNCDGCEASFYNEGHRPHFLFHSGVAAKLKSLGAKARGHLHDNCLTRTAHAHRAAKNAPPWPQFHPLPTGPVFFECENQFESDGIPMTANYGQFLSPKPR